MKTIWKYDIEADDHNHTLDIPSFAKLLHVGSQRPHTVTVWVEAGLDGGSYGAYRTFRVYSTGERIADKGIYVGTAFDGEYVWHLYEIG